MKKVITFIIVFISLFTFAQEDDKAQVLALKKANDYVYEANSLISNDNFVSAEMEYRKAISEKANTVTGTYNLGNAYYNSGNFEEALYRHQEAAKSATSKAEKHKAFHNIGNILMKNKKCKEAVEAYKSALRNDPSDNETRYNLGLAKICAEQQKDQQDKQDKDEDKKDEKKEDQENKENKDNKDNKDKEGDNKEDKKDQGDQEKKEGEDEKDDKGKPKDEKEDKGKGDNEKKEQQQPKPQPGQLSPQQIKNLLEAMNNQEQKVQEKINAEKQKGVKVKTEKDW
ncbi:Tetratricopeptide repeat-containing protein [Flaviramulus basaltis]|uniref:Tetratricopeptide repeat-containing protein n=1 Tax=Flaviramulus basaltis TaxID=369401 RepID=A0A1K2IDH2_9FLAO|nr:tetratricopeptide repeat protein [Flaviramulus basaltis]SFZ90441.1 Tetratricopeptide repeat-containing protein [Flaviramulus basaltis]